MNRSYQKLSPYLGYLVLVTACLVLLGATYVNFRQVFTVPGKAFFVDADCYSRMTRVRMIGEHPGAVIIQHDFENSPFGTRPHTTAPLDYAIALLRWLLKPFYADRALDLAGAWISPLLGLLTVVGVWLGFKGAKRLGRALALLVLAVSPILSHGFELGRPDHQSLILVCLAYALAAEWNLWQKPTRGWGIISGIAWAVGLWTSLYEPLVLLILVLLATSVWNRAAFRQRARLPGIAVGCAILLAAFWMESGRFTAATSFGRDSGLEYFAAWTRQIGELSSLPPWSATLYAWCGLGLLAAPLLLALNRSENHRLARANLAVLLAVFALTCWQARWGYFLPLVYVLSLPWQFETVPPRWRWLAGLVLLFGFWPTAREWQSRLWPSREARDRLIEQRTDASLLRDASDFIAGAAAQRPASGEPAATGILAPWWLSPPMAYWSGQPAVAGSSHEALPGTVDAARFFMATDARVAAEILRHRHVRWVIAYEPTRVQSTSATLLGLNPPPARFLELALYQRPEVVPRYLQLVFVNQYFKIYEVRVDSLPHE